jgi:triosephosphate isomerase
MNDRTPFLAGNWKMYKNRDQAVNLAYALKDLVGDSEGRDAAVFPSFSALEAVRRILADSPIKVGAQTCHFETEGAFTGEVSAEMLVDAGLDLVLVGHSERREFFGETDEIVRKKLDAALRAGIAPILCLRGPRRGNDEGHHDRLRAGLGDRHRPHRHPRAGPGRARVPARSGGRNVRRGHRPGRENSVRGQCETG